MIFSIAIYFIGEEGILLPVSDKKGSKTSLISTLANSIITLFGGTAVVCSGGACNSMYMSVFSSFLGSFGIVVTDLVPWLNGLTMVIILFTLYSLYLRRGFFFIPFYIGAVGGLLIFI